MMFVEAFPAFPIPILSICFDFRQQNASIHSDKSLTKEEAINGDAARSEKLILTFFGMEPQTKIVFLQLLTNEKSKGRCE